MEMKHIYAGSEGGRAWAWACLVGFSPRSRVGTDSNLATQNFRERNGSKKIPSEKVVTEIKAGKGGLGAGRVD